MLDVYGKWEELFAQAEKIEMPHVEAKEKVFYSGIGGSGIAGDMVNLLDPKFHYEVLRNLPTVPHHVGKDSLVIAVSYSGNTRETARTFTNALSRGASGVIMASGGKLEEYAKKKSIPFVKIAPAGMQPRVAFPLLLVPVLKLLNDTFSMGYDIHDLYRGVVESKDCAREAEKVAGSINGKIPVAYASKYLPIAKRFKQQINENCKYPAYYGEIPEIYHNEVEGYKREMNLFPLLIGDDSLDEVVCEIVKPYKIKPRFKSVMKNISGLVYLVDIISIYLANKIGEDPYSIEAIKKVKAATNVIIDKNLSL